MKTFLDPAITLQKVMGDQIYAALNGPIMEYLRQESNAGVDDDRAKEFQEYNNIMIEKKTFPELYRICLQAKQAVGFEQDINFYATSNPSINACSIAANNPQKQPHVVELNSGLVQLMSEKELLFVVGHEIGHLINGDSQLRKLRNFIYKEEDEVPDFITSRLNLYRLLSELSADRYGYIACGGDEETAITTMYKISSGIDIGKMNVQLKALIAENKKHLDYFLKSDKFIGDTHPVHPIRVYCLHLYATCKTQKQLDKAMEKIEDRFYQLSEEDATFNFFFVAAGWLLGNTDGEITDIQYQQILSNVGKRCWFPKELVQKVLDEHDLEQLYHHSIKLLVEHDEDNKVLMLDYLLSIAFIDGAFTENKLHFIYRYGHEVGLEDQEIAACISELIPRHFSINVKI